jgi:hypothetical protein
VPPFDNLQIAEVPIAKWTARFVMAEFVGALGWGGDPVPGAAPAVPGQGPRCSSSPQC